MVLRGQKLLPMKFSFQDTLSFRGFKTPKSKSFCLEQIENESIVICVKSYSHHIMQSRHIQTCQLKLRHNRFDISDQDLFKKELNCLKIKGFMKKPFLKFLALSVSVSCSSLAQQYYISVAKAFTDGFLYNF